MSNKTPTPRTDDMRQRYSVSENGRYKAEVIDIVRLSEKLESELTEVTKQRDALAEALRSIKNELGVPQPEYPAPVANAVKIADEALQSLTKPNEL
jgi:hypothetical protein